MIRRLALALFACAAAGAAHAQAPSPVAPGIAGASGPPSNVASLRTTLSLRDRALQDNTAWNLLEELTTDIGGRPVGSPAMTRAKDWGIAKLHALGFENVHAEAFDKPSWVRGPETADLIEPYRSRLSVLGLGSSGSGTVTADVVVFSTLAALIAAPNDEVKERIVVVNEPMVRAQDGSGYGPAGAARRQGPSIAAAKGAVGYLTRSISTSDSREPHTGSTTWAKGQKPIPAGALGVPDADLLERLSKKNRRVRITLSLESMVNTKATAWNVVGEIRGRERPNEVIVIGGHLDSWDPGQGAIDDASGIAITAAVGKLIADLPQRPKRTIRVVMFGSEETGGSSDAYLAAHKDEVSRIVLAGESDTGAGLVYQLRLPSGYANDPRVTPLAQALSPLKVFVSSEAPGSGGADVSGLVGAGVPAIALRQDMSRYFDLHHSASDTLDKVDPRELNQNVAAWVSLIHWFADSDIDFRQPAQPAAAR